ncbi:hypothetical protein DRO54_05355 [Candidatus Bathyarchaeota archaeon]|nr:MAG: hypothetical protein DRO54_05355 [Candidatus Bathyarchaeota archaeon]
MKAEFPERVYTKDEVKKAKEAIESGHIHRLKIAGSKEFKEKVREALKLIKITKQYDFLRTYIREIKEIDGLTQLREAEAAIWANKYAVKDPIDAASLFIQKTYQMKNYIEGKPYYGGEAEHHATQKRIEFLEELKKKTRKEEIKKRCEEILKAWRESIYIL